MTTTDMNSIGDIYQVDCPSCGSQICDLWDLGLPLRPGVVFSCSACDALVRILSVSQACLEVEEVEDAAGPTASFSRPLPRT